MAHVSTLVNYFKNLSISNSGLEVFVQSYSNTSGSLSAGYIGGVYSPTQNRIYLVPYGQATSTTWHYIDCNIGSLVGYTAPSLGSGAYFGGIYSPTQDRVYFAPFLQGNQSTWNHIDCATGSQAPKSIMAGPLFNKF